MQSNTRSVFSVQLSSVGVAVDDVVAPTSSMSGDRAAVIRATASSVPVSTSRMIFVAMRPVCPLGYGHARSTGPRAGREGEGAAELRIQAGNLRSRGRRPLGNSPVIAIAALAVALAGCGEGAGPTALASAARTAGPDATDVGGRRRDPADRRDRRIAGHPGGHAVRVRALPLPAGRATRLDDQRDARRGRTPSGRPGVDTFRDRFGHILSVVGEPVTDPGGWTPAIDRHLRGEHRLEVEATELLTVAGAAATLTGYHLPIPPSYLIHYLDAAFAGDGLGLVLLARVDDPATTRATGRCLDGFLESLEFGPP